MGFIRQHVGFCRTQKLKIPSLVISRAVRFVCIQNTSSSDVLGWPTWEAWAPQLECLGARRGPRKFYSGDQLWGLGALNKMLGSPKGSLKFSLEHSLALDKSPSNGQCNIFIGFPNTYPLHSDLPIDNAIQCLNNWTLTPVTQMDNDVNWINHHPADKAILFSLQYLSTRECFIV